jgi:Uma2 family endonuclease
MTDVLPPAGASPSTSAVKPAPSSPPVAGRIATEWPEGAPRHMTFEEFLAWDHEGIRAEWVDGEVVIVSPVRVDHQRLLQFLYRLLAGFVDHHGLGEVLIAPVLMRLASRPSGREPDLLFLAAAHADRARETYDDGPADLVVEIVSPESEERDRAEKFLEYEAARIPEYWLLDPLRRGAVFYMLGDDGRYHAAALDANGVYHSRVVEGFRLRVEWLWQKPLPRPETALRELVG